MCKKIVVIGDTQAMYHPLQNVDFLPELLDGYRVELTDDYNYFSRIGEYDLCISYLDAWEKTLSNMQAQSLVSYIKAGGRLLMLHNGISLQNTPALTPMLKARFEHHPPICDIEVKSCSNHPVCEGIDNFIVFDEPYHFDIYGEINVLAVYNYDGNEIPAAWESKYYDGTLVYLMPGHDAAAFECDMYRKLIYNCVRCLAG